MYEKNLDILLPRSFEMYEFMGSNIRGLSPFEDIKYGLAFQSGVLCFEHGLAMLTLLSDGFVSSGLCLLRPQYETLIRGFWLAYAKNDTWLNKLKSLDRLDASSLKKVEPPMLAEMLKNLEGSEAPQNILQQLLEYKELAIAPLNSFTHGGVLAMLKNSSAPEPKLLYDSIRNSNAIAAINMQMISHLAGNPEHVIPILQLHHRFVDCLPIIHA